MLPILIVLLLVLAAVGWIAGAPLAAAWRRRRIAARPFPSAWRQILQRRVPYFRRLPPDLQLQLKRHIQVFLAEKPVIGCDGLVITDEIRVTIAAQACLLILNRRSNYYPRLREILVYPGAFVVDRPHTDAIGLQQDQRQVLTGESWTRGQVVLSWSDTLEGTADPADGRNVVIHEFAHQLDQEKGRATGAPILARRQQYGRWSQVLGGEFARLRQALATGQATMFDPYGATDPAEFFSVVSEAFFEQPHRMAAEHPALYQQLSGFYRIDPLSW